MKKESEAVMEKETKQVEAPVRKTIPIQYPYMNEQSIQNVVEVMRSRWIGQAEKVEEFEAMIKQQLKIPFPVTVNSGTAAVHLALDIAGVGPGDEVITTSLTCAATNHAILMQYAKPVFADVQYDTGNIDPEDIEHRITPKTKAVLVVHWAGYPCDMDEINAIAKKHNLPVIEDAAHAMGASYKGKPMGTISDFTCFSLQAIKHITTGDGGILCTNNIQDYQKGIRRRWFGIDRNHRIPSVLGHADYDIVERGFKYHMNDIAAAIGLAQLPDLPKIVARRKAIARRYREELADVQGIKMMEYKNDRDCSYWLFTMHVHRREEFCRAMLERGVEVSVSHYRNDIYTIFGPRRKDLPNVDKIDNDMMCIPIHAKLSDEDVTYVIDAIKKGW